MRSTAAGLAVLAAAWLLAPAEFLRAYLFSWLFWASIPLGALGWTAIHRLTGGAWADVVGRSHEAAVRTLPVVALLFLPILFGLETLYPWARPQAAHDPILVHKALYLNKAAFTARAVLYFGLWIALGRALLGLPADRAARVAAPGLVVLGLTASFASFDWSMSLDPHWYSTIWGVIFAAGALLASLAAALVVAGCRTAGTDPPASESVHDAGNLLLALVMFWTYVVFAQYLIIWSGNLPEEVGWYMARSGPAWAAISVLLILFHFAVPFLLLLHRPMKRDLGRLAPVAAGLLLMRLVDGYWVVAPSLAGHGAVAGPAPFHPGLLDVVVPAALGAVLCPVYFGDLEATA